MPLTIKSDHKWKAFQYRGGVPKRILASEFDYQKEDEATDGFFKYRGHWYHVDQFTVVPLEVGPYWSGYLSDSYCSGILIKLSTDGECYQVATFIN